MEEKYGITTKKTYPYIPNCLSPLIPIFLNSFKIIFLDYPLHFFTIYVVAALPLSFLLTSLSISQTPRQLKIYLAHLEWLSRIVSTIQETKNVWETSQDELRKLYHFRVLHVVPILGFSLLTVVATVTSTSSSLARDPTKKCRPTMKGVVMALKDKWVWPLLMCVINCFVWIMWGHVLPMLTTVAGYPAAVVVLGVGVVVEVYAMAVLSLALVVSVQEEWAGLEVVWAGSGLMKGRRGSGWVLSGLILLTSNLIGREMVGLVDGQDWETSGDYFNRAVDMRVGCMVGLVILLGWMVLWSNVLFTVCYCEWRNINVNRSEELDGDAQFSKPNLGAV